MKNKGMENIIGLSEFILKEIRRLTTQSELTSLLKDYVNSVIGREKLYFMKIISPILQSCKIYTSYKISPFSAVEMKEIKNGYTFSAKSLVMYLFSHDKLDNIIDEVSREYKNIKDTIKLQIVELAVNEATTKSFIPAVITELYQNSVDAIRSTNVEDKRIEININKDSLSVTDYVGVENKNLIALMIPFLSTKEVGDVNVTGEMGTGFFNLFRQPYSKGIYIETITGDRRTILHGIPIKVGNVVVDIEYTLKSYKRRDEEKNGTKITVFFNEEKDIISQSIADGYVFVRNNLGYMKDIKVYLNGELIMKKLHTIYESTYGTLFYVKNDNVPSLIMTNFIPFSDFSFLSQLENVYRELITFANSQFVINFNKNAYTPVHSRTKVNIKEDVSSFINISLYLGIMYLYSNGKIDMKDEIIAHTTSTQNIHQLYLSTVNYGLINVIPSSLVAKKEGVNNFFTMFDIPSSLYNVGIGNNCEIVRIGEIINEIIKGNNFTFFSDKYDDIISKSIILWFSNKKLYKEEIQEKKKEREKIFTKFTFLQPFVDIFWDKFLLFQDKGIVILDKVNNNPPPTLYIGEIEEGVKGYFSMKENMILLNSRYFSYKEIEKEIMQYKGINIDKAIPLIRLNDKLNPFFSPAMPASTLIHELFHAIDSTSHSESKHNIISIEINGKKNISFDQAAVEIFQLALSDGLLFEYFSQI
jgi:hypothetical protein